LRETADWAVTGASAPWQLHTVLSAPLRRAVLTLLDEAERELGREAIDEGLRLLLFHGGEAEHWLQTRGDRLLAYACARAACTEPGGRRVVTVELAGGGLDPLLLSALLARHGTVEWWLRDVGDPVGCGDDVAQQALRDIDFMTLELGDLRSAGSPAASSPSASSPEGEPLSASSLGANLPAGLEVRAFVPSSDAQAWLELNGLAFANHPDQGSWTQHDLLLRLQEPWFDPAGFFLIEREGRLLASLWTKLHRRAGSCFGEVYVLAVHPEARGLGLARLAVHHAARWLVAQGIQQLALYVDCSNQPAVRLYQSLGFTTRRRDRLVRLGEGARCDAASR
jgi:mycothiol synthase